MTPTDLFEELLKLKWKMKPDHPLSFTLDKDGFLSVKIHHSKDHLRKYTVIGKEKLEYCCNEEFVKGLYFESNIYQDNTLDL